ncbi:hypothetical protein TNCV_1692471 [Trichonephila clavipes]|nr:hypothetical protein TNCV_1692471 [Trichonephila clavipes]
MLERIENKLNLLEPVAICDETWIFTDDPERRFLALLKHSQKRAPSRKEYIIWIQTRFENGGDSAINDAVGGLVRSTER